jgi:hypothetical protein
VLVIVRDLKHHLLGYFILHIIGKAARFVGEFAPGLTTTEVESSLTGIIVPRILNAPRPAVLKRRAGTGHVASGWDASMAN